MNEPLAYLDPDGNEAVAALATTSMLLAEGSGSAAAGIGLTAGAFTGAAILGTGAAGYGVGTLIRRVPGVDAGIQAVTDQIVDTIFAAQNYRHTLTVANGLIEGALIQVGKIAAAGGPDRDPDHEHHKTEIKAALERASRMAKRLPKKLQTKVLQKINQIADSAGVRLSE